MGFLGLMDRKNHFIISAEEFQLIFSTFLCLIFKLKSPSSTSFGLYFAFAEYCTDQSVQRTGTIPLTYSRGTVLSAEESVGTVLSVDF